MSVREYLTLCEVRYPQLYRRLNSSRVSVERLSQLYKEIAVLNTHFEGNKEKGRGDSYREAQNANYLVRSVGFMKILNLAVPQRVKAGPDSLVLDALGGNGTLTRIARASRPSHEVPFIVTNDVSARMIESALEQGLPAIRQPLQDLVWFDDGIFDAVIVAYGTHHIPVSERQNAIAEAYRVLKPGGRIVLQDFEIGCLTTRWYQQTLDRYTLTGHKYDYFSRQELDGLLVGNSFIDVNVFNSYDPFILYSDDPKVARLRLLEYVSTLFGLVKLVPPGVTVDEKVWQELETIIRDSSTFDYFDLPADASVNKYTILKNGERYRAEIPRVCLVATGRRPG